MLGKVGLPEILIIAVVLIVLFGRGKVSSLMGEMGQGIRAFKKGLQTADADDAPEVRDVPALSATAREDKQAEAAGSLR